MAIPAEAQGITAAILCAVFSTANLMISKILQAWDWPYFFLAGLSALCITLGLAITMACQKTYKLQRREVKWVILRGFFGCGNNVLSVCAVLAGAEVGSVGALGCVNTVVAALLGRLVLGEALGKLHILAVVFSLTGAVLISDPAHAISSMGSSLLGNLLALMAGVSLGCMFISSRKSGSASSMMLTTLGHAAALHHLLVLAFHPSSARRTLRAVGKEPSTESPLLLLPGGCHFSHQHPLFGGLQEMPCCVEFNHDEWQLYGLWVRHGYPDFPQSSYQAHSDWCCHDVVGCDDNGPHSLAEKVDKDREQPFDQRRHGHTQQRCQCYEFGFLCGLRICRETGDDSFGVARAKRFRTKAAFAVDAAGNSLWCTSVSMSEESLAVGKQVNKYGDMKFMEHPSTMEFGRLCEFLRGF